MAAPRNNTYRVDSGRGVYAGLPNPPLGAVFDLMDAAHAAGHMWVRLDNPAAPTFESTIPPDDLLDFSGGVPNRPNGVFWVWSAWAYDRQRRAFRAHGVGHANSSAGEFMSFNLQTRGFQLDFNGPELVQVGPAPLYRSKDFTSPVSAHNYSTTVMLPVSGRMLLLPGASYGDGGSNKVFDPGIVGNQPGLRPVGAYTIDMTLAGQGYVVGATGSNAARGAFAGTALPGANASKLRDWFDPAHPTRPVIGGNSYHVYADRGAVAVEEGGQDVVYYTAGTGLSLLRAVIHPGDNGALDVITREFNDIEFGAEGEALSGGNIAMNPARRLLVSLARGQAANPPFQFVDLNRAPGDRKWRKPVSVGGDAAALKAESKGEPGLVFVPMDDCWVAFTRGNIASPGVSPQSVWMIYAPPADPITGITPDTGWSVVRRDAPGGSPVPSVAPMPGELFPAVCRRFAEGPGFPLLATRYQVWGYVPQAWNRSLAG